MKKIQHWPIFSLKLSKSSKKVYFLMIFYRELGLVIYIIIHFDSIQNELNFFAWIFVFLPCRLVTIYNRCYDQCLHGMFKLIKIASTKLNFFKTLFSRKIYIWWKSWYNNIHTLISIFNSTFLKPYSTFLSLFMLAISEQKNNPWQCKGLFLFANFEVCAIWTRKKMTSVLEVIFLHLQTIIV